jgi:hypothetical protein
LRASGLSQLNRRCGGGLLLGNVFVSLSAAVVVVCEDSRQFFLNEASRFGWHGTLDATLIDQRI